MFNVADSAITVGVVVVLRRVAARRRVATRLRRHAERRRRRSCGARPPSSRTRTRSAISWKARPCGLRRLRRRRSAGPIARLAQRARRAAPRRGTARRARAPWSAPPPWPKSSARAPQPRAEVVAHVLDHAEHGRVHLLEHLDAAPDVGQRDVLRRRDDDAAGDRHLLRERELHVAGAGREVDHQDVEVAPVAVAEELGDRAW